MIKIVGVFALLSLMTLLGSCSTVRKVGLGAATPVFKDTVSGLEKEGNWEQFRKATPGNLSLVDGLLSVRPTDESLLLAAIKGNAGYAFGVEETLYLDDLLAENDETFHKDQAIYYYSKAVKYGETFLKDNDLTLQDLAKAQKEPQGVRGLLDAQFSSDDTTLELMLFFAQSMGSLINLQKDNILLIAQLPVVKGIFDWVCDLKPDIAHGTCQIFYGTYEAGRPATLGGNPGKGKNIFETFISEHPDNWLARISLIQYYAIPMYDENVYYVNKKEFEKYEDIFASSLSWKPGLEINENFKDPTLRLYQAIAIKRFQIIKKYEDDLF